MRLASYVDIKRCKHCGTEETVPQGASPPPGWLSLSVTVPAGVTTKKGQPFLWIGLFCSVACLLQNGPELERAEALAGWRQQGAG